ncbi:MAG: hypothetical protein GPOALKHO_001838 [Sodalis sp.]|nr:MAG: hypothetical protein GPOALKHO_001838 [Sodalis sp.]
MTRKRTCESIEHVLCSECPTCHCRGTVKTIETVCYEIMREIVRVYHACDFERFLVYALVAVHAGAISVGSPGKFCWGMFLVRQKAHWPRGGCSPARLETACCSVRVCSTRRRPYPVLTQPLTGATTSRTGWYYGDKHRCLGVIDLGQRRFLFPYIGERRALAGHSCWSAPGLMPLTPGVYFPNPLNMGTVWWTI